MDCTYLELVDRADLQLSQENQFLVILEWFMYFFHLCKGKAFEWEISAVGLEAYIPTYWPTAGSSELRVPSTRAIAGLFM